MDDDGPAGAEAAAVYFLQLDSYMQATGDTTEFEAMSHSTCEFCAKRLDQARRIQEGGYTWTGGENKSMRILHTYAQDQPTGIWPIDVEYIDSAATVTDATGAVHTEIEGVTARSRVEMAQQDGRWVCVNVAELRED